MKTSKDNIEVENFDTGNCAEFFNGELPAPVIVKLGSLSEMSDSGVSLASLEGNLGGTYTFDKEVGALKLTYSIPDSDKLARFRMMPVFAPNRLTANHKYMRITYMTPAPIAASINIINSAYTSSPITVVDDTSVSNGHWVTSNAVDISVNEVLQLLIDGKHCTIGYTSTSDSSAIYIKELAFFATKAQAYNYYGDEETFVGDGMSVFTLGPTPFGLIRHKPNEEYKVPLSFPGGVYIDQAHRFIRILYSAKNPCGVNEDVSMYMCNNKGESYNLLLQDNLKNTGGEYVLSETATISDDMMQRCNKEGLHKCMKLCVNTTLPGGDYSVKEMYFFSSKKAADAFKTSAGDTKVSILGNDISKYQIVIPDEFTWKLKGAADVLSAHIKSISGVELPIVTDDAPATDYEIILGLGNRTESKELYASMAEKSPHVYEARIMGNKLVIVSSSHYAVATGANFLMESFLYKGKTTVHKTINIDNYFNHGFRTNEMTVFTGWAPYDNVANPEVFTDNFDADNGYWQEENNDSQWSIGDGKLRVDASKTTITYLHVYEPNATISAKLAYSKAGVNGKMALMLRCSAIDAYLTAGYDFGDGEWYIDCREGNDFAPVRLASVKAPITKGTEYLVAFTATKETASLSVDGKQIITVNDAHHVTPGRIGFYAKDAAFTADDAEVVLLSGKGVIMRNVIHNRVPDETLREGGTVIELTDGTLIYQHMTVSFKSVDSGKTWTRLDDIYFDTDGYHPQIFRLNNGDILQIRVISGGRYATISKDDGKTWIQGGLICPKFYKDSKAGNLNMNDKITQMSNGRIFYSQSYTASGDKAYRGLYHCFDIFYYSDDNGMTWKESETGTFDIKGNEDRYYFAESKILECADGTLRLYNSWNNYHCIVYSESKDNGVTWGPIVTMPEFICSRASMQLVRDRYADNDTTYYMVWVNSFALPDEGSPKGKSMTRAALSLAKTTDGKNWDYIGDVWRWNHRYMRTTAGAQLAHIVDPCVQCTKDAIIVASGLSEYLPVLGDRSHKYHGAQRQHIWYISRETVDETARPMK